MHILFLSQYFDPEPVLKGFSFAKELVEQGHDVEVLTGFPNYPTGRIYPNFKQRLFQCDDLNGIKIIRVPIFPSHDTGGFRRILTYLSFAFSSTFLGLFIIRKPDIIYACHGNATVGLPAFIIGLIFRAPYVLDIQDLWPDSIVSSGMLPTQFKPILPVVSLWCKFIYSQATCISVISEGFKSILIGRNVSKMKLTVIPNWCDEHQIKKAPLDTEDSLLFKDHFNIVMAGNMGKMQGLDIVIDAAAKIQTRYPHIQFILVGDGVERFRLEKRAVLLGLKNIIFLERRPIDKIGAIIFSADALLLHLKGDPLLNTTVPSRLQAYLAIGRPILCGVSGEGAHLVSQANAGISFKPDSSDDLVDAIETLAGLPRETLMSMGNSGQQYYKKNLSLKKGTHSFVKLFEQAIENYF